MTAAAHPAPDHGRPPFADASPAQVRAALIPKEALEFDREWRAVMAKATDTFDLAEVYATLDSWRRVAWLTVSAGHEAHRRMYRRAAAALEGRDVPDGEPLARTKARLGL